MRETYGNIRINEHRSDSLLLQCLEGLGSRIIKFSGLSDGKSSTSDNQDLFHVNQLRCSCASNV